ncbi:MAG: hypothetical protein ACOCUV_00855, partial [bacterium]
MKQKLFLLSVLIFSANLCFSQGNPIRFKNTIPNRILLADKVNFGFNVDKSKVERFRYKLDMPGDWKGGIRYAVKKWSEWNTGSGVSIMMKEFNIEGEYKFVVEYDEKETNKAKSVVKRFKVYWEYPEIRSQAFRVNNGYINSAKTEKEKYRRAAVEYKKSFDMWMKKCEYEHRRLNLAKQSTEEIVELLSETVITTSSGTIISACGGILAAKVLLGGAALYSLIRQGYTTLAIIYRSGNANLAFTMAAISKS